MRQPVPMFGKAVGQRLVINIFGLGLCHHDDVYRGHVALLYTKAFPNQSFDAVSLYGETGSAF